MWRSISKFNWVTHQEIRRRSVDNHAPASHSDIQICCVGSLVYFGGGDAAPKHALNLFLDSIRSIISTWQWKSSIKFSLQHRLHTNTVLWFSKDAQPDLKKCTFQLFTFIFLLMMLSFCWISIRWEFHTSLPKTKRKTKKLCTDPASCPCHKFIVKLIIDSLRAYSPWPLSCGRNAP